MANRTCSKCDETKSIDSFSFNKSTGYHHSWCKDCMREYARIKNRERSAKKKKEKEKQTIENKKPEKVFADILARKRLTEDNNSV